MDADYLNFCKKNAKLNFQIRFIPAKSSFEVITLLTFEMWKAHKKRHKKGITRGMMMPFYYTHFFLLHKAQTISHLFSPFLLSTFIILFSGKSHKDFFLCIQSHFSEKCAQTMMQPPPTKKQGINGAFWHSNFSQWYKPH